MPVLVHSAVKSLSKLLIGISSVCLSEGIVRKLYGGVGNKPALLDKKLSVKYLVRYIIFLNNYSKVRLSGILMTLLDWQIFQNINPTRTPMLY